MVRKRKRTSWKPVQLTENLISKGIEGLVGIEELTNYKVVTDDARRNVNKVGK
jgi:hypothetical protein